MDPCFNHAALDVPQLLVLGVAAPAFILTYVLLYSLLRLMLHDNPAFDLKFGRKKLSLEPFRKVVGATGFAFSAFGIANFLVPLVTGQYYANQILPLLQGNCGPLESVFIITWLYASPIAAAAAAIFIFRRIYYSKTGGQLIDKS